MEGDLESLAKAFLWVTASMTYVRFASSKIRPGKLRLLTLLPVLPLLLNLPWSFSSMHLRSISAFFLAWLALFKLLLLAFGLGPLSPSLPLLPFLSSATLPVKLLPSSKSKPTSSLSGHRLFTSAVKALLYATIIKLYRYRDEFHQYLLLSLNCSTSLSNLSSPPPPPPPPCSASSWSPSSTPLFVPHPSRISGAAAGTSWSPLSFAPPSTTPSAHAAAPPLASSPPSLSPASCTRSWSTTSARPRPPGR